MAICICRCKRKEKEKEGLPAPPLAILLGHPRSPRRIGVYPKPRAARKEELKRMRRVCLVLKSRPPRAITSPPWVGVQSSQLAPSSRTEPTVPSVTHALGLIHPSRPGRRRIPTECQSKSKGAAMMRLCRGTVVKVLSVVFKHECASLNWPHLEPL